MKEEGDCKQTERFEFDKVAKLRIYSRLFLRYFNYFFEQQPKKNFSLNLHQVITRFVYSLQTKTFGEIHN